MGTAPHCAAKSSKKIRSNTENKLVKIVLALNPAEMKTLM
jgi:hypothetical protein